MASITELKSAISECEERLAILKAQLQDAERRLQQEKKSTLPLPLADYKRYSRQMLVPQVGLKGQLKIKNASVLIVGAGGLGCPAAAYLAGAGVGRLGFIDGDEIDISNLHRQMLYSEAKTGTLKVSAMESALRSVNFSAYPDHLTPEKAVSLFSEYDIVLDCTDAPSTRYMISDAAVIAGKPLVSASALQTHGQLFILNNPPSPPGDANGGLCYRCIFPKPPPPETVMTCGDGGILGPVVGIMGVLQALEALKLILQEDLNNQDTLKPSMLLFNAFADNSFRTMRLRSRRPDCSACSAKATVTANTLNSGSIDYAQFCGIAPLAILPKSQKIAARAYADVRGDPHILLDVREDPHYNICNLPQSLHVPFSKFKVKDAIELPLQDLKASTLPIYVVCQRGNDSQAVVKRLIEEEGLSKNGRIVMDIDGGFVSWRKFVDSEWPEY